MGRYRKRKRARYGVLGMPIHHKSRGKGQLGVGNVPLYYKEKTSSMWWF